MAITAGTKAEAVVRILRQLPERKREKVMEVTLDMAGNTELIVKRCLPISSGSPIGRPRAVPCPNAGKPLKIIIRPLSII
ncbi:hypothetical protein [Emticicia sp. CRIBPO]|uniref:hypothetical protein n=1 Tax=Emticicia sp. CRIBPO TaxID=2683258 RepID=UPI00286D7DAC|nr:hypothetical protein [Emticicia sp. CRIBPO]